MNVGLSNSVADIINRTADGGSTTLLSCKLRQQQTVRNIGVQLLRSDKKRQTPKLSVECETQHIITHTHTHARTLSLSHTHTHTRKQLTVADVRLLSVSVRWCGSHLRKNLEVRILLRKVRGCLTTHTWMSPSWSSLYRIPLLLQWCRVLLHGPAPSLVLLLPSDISPSRGLFSSH